MENLSVEKLIKEWRDKVELYKKVAAINSKSDSIFYVCGAFSDGISLCADELEAKLCEVKNEA